MKERLGILLLSRPQTADIRIIRGLCRAAIERGVEVEIFLMGDAVNRLEDPDLRGLTGEGARMSFCAQNAVENRLDQHPDYPWGIEEGSQYALACMVERSDRFLAFA